MKVFVWSYVQNCGSGAYHPGGGLVIFAETEARARELATSRNAIFKENPDDVREVIGGTERVYIFPDAGCC